MFGGAAGGGKSDFLLMAASQYVDLPHYRALILRRKSVDLERSEAILERARTWWNKRNGVQFFAQKKKFVFPSGATIEFGHANNVGDEVENYQGGAWHFIGFDEATQFEAKQILYLFSRNRRTKGDAGRPAIPLRMRLTANPGGVSHHFLRDRFMSMEYARDIVKGCASPYFTRLVRYPDGGAPDLRYFIPSKIMDNPSLDSVEYIRSLHNLDVVTREQLMSGDWLIAAAGRFKPEWFRRFIHPNYNEGSGGYYRILNGDGSTWKIFNQADCTRFMTIDPAGTEAERTEEEKKGKEPCYSVISTFDLTNDYGFLFWRGVQRLQGEFPDVMEAIRTEWREQGRPAQIFVEEDGIGRPYYQQLARERFPVYAISSEGKDKLTRATPATNEAKEGRIFLPEYAPWLSECEAELFSWRAVKGEVCDQIDTLAHAVNCKLNDLVGGAIVVDVNAAAGGRRR